MGTKVYCNSSVGRLLQNARERCQDSDLKTKKGLSKHLGITPERLKNIELGFSVVPFELAMEWCDATGATLEKEAVQHIYGAGLPPTDPRLTNDLNLQLMNYIKQATEGIKAAQEIMNLQITTRSWKLDEKAQQDYAKHAQEIFDTIQATQCVIQALDQLHVGMKDQVKQNWLRKALSGDVIVRSTDSLVALTKAL